MANTKAAGDSGATSSTKTAGTNTDAEAKAADEAAESESFKPVEMSRTRDGQKRTAHSLEDVVAFEFDGFRKPSK